MIVGIDPSLTSTGVCINGECYLVATNALTTNDPLRAVCERTRAIMEVIYEQVSTAMASNGDASLVFYIEGPMLGPNANHLFEIGTWYANFYTGFGMYRIVAVHPSTLKKYIGAVGKKDISLAVYKKWGAEFPGDKTDDKAVAYSLYRLGRDVENGQYTIPEPKRRGTGVKSTRAVSKRKTRHTTTEIQ